MLTVVIILLTFVALCVIVAKPKVGTYVIWFVLFLYPHTFWFKLGLPWNIGADDIFFIVLFLVVVTRRNILGGISIRF